MCDVYMYVCMCVCVYVSVWRGPGVTGRQLDALLKTMPGLSWSFVINVNDQVNGLANQQRTITIIFQARTHTYTHRQTFKLTQTLSLSVSSCSLAGARPCFPSHRVALSVCMCACACVCVCVCVRVCACVWIGRW
jgi:hypothetical protein